MGIMIRYHKYTEVFCSDYAILTNRMYLFFVHNTPGLLGFTVCIKRVREPVYSFRYQTAMIFQQQRNTDWLQNTGI